MGLHVPIGLRPRSRSPRNPAEAAGGIPEVTVTVTVDTVLAVVVFQRPPSGHRGEVEDELLHGRPVGN